MGAPAMNVPREASVVLALASLPDIGPARLNALLDEGRPHEAWQVVLEGRAHHGPASCVMGDDPAALAAKWARAASAIDADQLWRRHQEAGVGVAWRGDDAFPETLRLDPHGPGLIVWRGTLAALDGPRVAIVGTRDCTRSGRDFARRLAVELTDAGVRIVSGLALGIDAAAHSGALSSRHAPPVAVVGSGVDVVYPRRNAELWAEVSRVGVLLSEHPLGTAPVGWHFLARNRIIATLADVVVVVESHERGGALQTATEAARRGVPVLAVPGSVRSSASKGTNALLRDAQVCCDTADVLTMLGLSSRRTDRRETRPMPDSGDAVVLEALGWEPTGLEALLVRTGRTIGDLALALDRLEAAGWIARRGGWAERIDAQARP
jgi:DNA processing protein